MPMNSVASSPEPDRPVCAPGRHRLLRLYGVQLGSRFPMRSHTAPATGPADLTFSCGRRLPEGLRAHIGAGGTALSPVAGLQGTRIYLERLPAVDVIRYPCLFDFYVWDNGIFCHLHAPAHADRVEMALLGTVMSFWLERSGVPNLHASAVEVDGHGVPAGRVRAHHGRHARTADSG
jgi:hypothetical protein